MEVKMESSTTPIYFKVKCQNYLILENFRRHVGANVGMQLVSTVN